MFVAVGFAFFWKKNVVEITAKKTASSLESIENSGQEIPTPPDPPESENKINSQNEAGINQENGSSDIEPQSPLANPPSVIKAAYFTGWSAGSSKKVDYIIDLARTTEINAVVIDVKDYSGYVGYDIQIPEVIKYNAKETRISKINALIKKLHDEGIYVIARITIFQDPRLAKARPDLAVKSKATGDVWRDRKGLSWMDPSNKEVWDYNISIAKDASARGFDEINFDYIRFPSDGKINDMKFSSWDEKSPKHETIRKFFRYLCSQMGDIKISADLFGLATVQSDD
ncbi:hypothetical protein HY227_01730, partial [Candidatus Wolfebacteria bacterium]|nr:hypothetical protein [Candidatus Wolfebacteria bacterium]